MRCDRKLRFIFSLRCTSSQNLPHLANEDLLHLSMQMHFWLFYEDHLAQRAIFFRCQPLSVKRIDFGSSSSPTMTANWEAESTGDRLTVPYGGGIGKIFKIGGHPFRWSTQVFGYAATPDAVDTDWTLQAEFRLLFP